MKDLKWVVLNFLSCSKEGMVRNALYGYTVDNVDWQTQCPSPLSLACTCCSRCWKCSINLFSASFGANGQPFYQVLANETWREVYWGACGKPSAFSIKETCRRQELSLPHYLPSVQTWHWYLWGQYGSFVQCQLSWAGSVFFRTLHGFILALAPREKLHEIWKVVAKQQPWFLWSEG